MRRWCARSTDLSLRQRLCRLSCLLLCLPGLASALPTQDLPPGTAESATSAASANRDRANSPAELELNTASRAALESLDGLGPALVDRLLLARTLRRFSDWQDAQRRVSGLGPKLAARLSAQGLRVDGRRFEGLRSDRH